ncbi:MAG: phosphodiester glycosidase family protein [Eubacteriales bacterium]|nr:phosphodiester glycosidase family protein [Eubacteriales bacterium]
MKRICAVLALIIVLAALAGCTAQVSTPTAAPTPVMETATPEATPTAEPTPTPSPTPEPTPTPDPLDALFAGEGEEVIQYKAAGAEIDPYAKGASMPDYWLYNSHDLRIEITMKRNEDLGIQYYVADIRVRNEQQMVSIFNNPASPGTRDSKDKYTKPARLSRREGVIFAQNGDFMTFNEKEMKGPIIRNGVCYWEGSTGSKCDDIMAFMPDGSLKIYGPGEITADELLAQGVKNTLAFGPTLVVNGAVNTEMRNPRKINGSNNPRSGIGMVEPNHYISIVVEGRLPRSKGISCEGFAQLFVENGCSVAYNLDGGASSALVFMGNMCNQTINDGDTYLGPRPMIDMLSFGASDDVPGQKDPYYSDGQIKK